MILHPEILLHHHAALAGAPLTAPMAMVPTWLRRVVLDAHSLAAKQVEDIAITAGAAIGALDAVVRRQERWAGAWRQRLGLAAAAATVKQAGRIEDESALRDAVLLTRPGDFLSSRSTNPGPAGLLLLGWRRLAARPGDELLIVKNLAAVLEEFGYAPNDEVVSDLADDLRQLGATEGAVGTLTGAFMVAERYGFERAVGAWFADALLAQRLGWTHAVPLLGADTGQAPDRVDRRPVQWRQASRQILNVPKVCLLRRRAPRCGPSIFSQSLSAGRTGCLPLPQDLGPRQQTPLSKSSCPRTRSSLRKGLPASAIADCAGCSIGWLSLAPSANCQAARLSESMGFDANGRGGACEKGERSIS